MPNNSLQILVTSVKHCWAELEETLKGGEVSLEGLKKRIILMTVSKTERFLLKLKSVWGDVDDTAFSPYARQNAEMMIGKVVLNFG